MSLSFCSRRLLSCSRSVSGPSVTTRSRSVATSSKTLTSSSTPSSASSTAKESLPWNQFFQLRRSQRRWGLATTLPTTILGGAVGGNYFINLESDPTQPLFGIEPYFVYGIATLGCVFLGYLVGPTSGKWLWKMTHRKVLGPMEAKERIFIQHIKKNRVDPSSQTMSNPIPDFYGEKIGSLRGYRQWLRDQNTYRRKSVFGGSD